MRKRIAVLTISPESDHNKDILSGIFEQAKKADYDVCVFSPMVQISHRFKEYLTGELNIYELINFDMFDGVLIMPVSMMEERISFLTDRLLKKIKLECNVPVVSVEDSFGDYPFVKIDNVGAFEEIAEHVIKEHNARNIVILAGMEGFEISEDRIKGCKIAFERNGIDPESVPIHYGNFWYNSGEELADKIVNGDIEKPEAIICASDHMAIGVVSRLLEQGMKVPEDIIVTGYGAAKEAILCTPPITSYKPREKANGAASVLRLRELIEPESEKMEAILDDDAGMCIGGTCGCREDHKFTRDKLANLLFLNERNYVEDGDWKGVDVGMLLESYTSEILTKTETVEECFDKIFESMYLLKPYEWFYLCLSEDWMDRSKDKLEGYSDKMKLVISSDMANMTNGYDNHVFVGKGREVEFDLKDMLPALSKKFDEPQVFFFTPVHFNERTLGYAVFQNKLDCKNIPGVMHKNYLRILSNAIEMTRIRYRITEVSEHDLLTGLYNRRGMERKIERLKEKSKPGDKWMIYVIDMDGLKKVNDNYGHNYGDEGIKTIARAVRDITGKHEICARAGGDEFYIFGCGEYSDDDAKNRVEEFSKAIAYENSLTGLEISFNASIGYYICDSENDPMVEVSVADVKMYEMKKARKMAAAVTDR